MKKEILLLLLLLPLTATIFGQERYYPGATVKGKKVTYHCKKGYYGDYVLLANARNRETTNTFYHLQAGDQVVIGHDNFHTLPANYSQSDLYKIIKKSLTSSEWKLLKAKRHRMKILVTADSKGNTAELSFEFDRKTEALQNIPPDRFYSLEKKLKELIKIQINDPKYQNIKYSIPITFLDFNRIRPPYPPGMPKSMITK